jgi:hypothetical protein
MRRESLLGRTLWPVLLVALVGYVVADFVHYPVIASTGSAAVPTPQVTLWVAATESGGEAEVVARDAAASLELHGRSTTIKTLQGGSSQAVAGFLAAGRRGRGTHGAGSSAAPAPAQLLVLTSTTLADLARDRDEQLVPGAALEAAVAQALLRRAIPIGVLSDDPLALAVPRDAEVRTSGELLAAMRADPARQLFAIDDDAYSRDQLAALVQRAGVPGRTRFSVLPSGREAAAAMELGDANAVLTSRSALAGEARARRLRALAWPFGRGRAPVAWAMLLAPPGMPAAQVATLRRAVAALVREPQWRRVLRRQGRAPAQVGAAALPGFVPARAAEAEQLQRLAREVEGR